MELQIPTITKNTIFLIINGLLLGLGFSCGPMIMRLYFRRGGKRVWLSAFLETGGWPIILIPLIIAYIQRRRKNPQTKAVYMRPRVFFSIAVIGILTGLDDYLYAYGVAKLPVSTASLIIASQLAFTAVFSYFLVKQKFTAYSLNSVVMLTLGAVVLGLHTNGDRPNGESSKDYWMGFVLTLVGAVLYGLVLPLIEMMYQHAKQTITFTLVMEVQVVMCFFSTLFCTIGMAINNDFQAIGREAKADPYGVANYYIVLVFSAIIWQAFFMGAVGVIYYSSSLLSAIIIAMFLPITEVLAVIFYKEKFQVEKGLSLFLSMWGFASYFLGEMKQNREKKLNEARDLPAETQLPTRTSPPV